MIAKDTKAGQRKSRLLEDMPSWKHSPKGPRKYSWEDTANKDDTDSWVPLTEQQSSRTWLMLADVKGRGC
jgi:hypothetical protein